MAIDAHQHFWHLADRAGEWPPPELAAIHRDFAPDDLRPHLAVTGVEGTVLVQSLPRAADTDFMLGLAERHAFIRGVVGWVDLKAPDGADEVRRRATAPRLKGLRPMLQSLPDDWLDDPALDPAVRAMLDCGLRFDALVLPHQLAALLRFADRFPALPIVIDHGAKPAIGAGGSLGWREAMAALADRPQVLCKLSGLLTEAGDRRAPEDIRPYAETLLALFGADRLMWGSDWPVLELAGTYPGWHAMAHDLIPAADHEAVFGQTARRFYGLD